MSEKREEIIEFTLSGFHGSNQRTWQKASQGAVYVTEDPSFGEFSILVGSNQWIGCEEIEGASFVDYLVKKIKEYDRASITAYDMKVQELEKVTVTANVVYEDGDLIEMSILNWREGEPREVIPIETYLEIAGFGEF